VPTGTSRIPKLLAICSERVAACVRARGGVADGAAGTTETPKREQKGGKTRRG